MKPNQTRYGITDAAPLRALVADDDRDMRQLIVSVLRAGGFEVSGARNGAERLEIAEAAGREDGVPPDLVVSDVRMPGTNGLEALRTVRNRLQGTAVVVITASGDDATHAEATNAGAVGVLHKPFDLADLLALARRVTARPPLHGATEG